MIRRAFFVLLVFALAGVVGSARPSLFRPMAIAQVTPTPIPFSCFFAAFNQFNNLFNSGIACSTPSPAPTGSGNFTSLVCSGLATCSPATGPTPHVAVASPMPTATSTGCGALSWGGTFPYTLTGNFSSCAANATPSPSATSTGCGTLSWTGSWPYTINGNFTACGPASNGVSLYTPAPIPTNPGALVTPQYGYIAVGGVYISPTGTPSPNPQAILVPTTAGTCATTGRSGSVSWGTDNISQVIGTPIYGVFMRVGCDQITAGGDAATGLAFDGSNLAVAGSFYAGTGSAVARLFFQNSTGIDFQASSSSDNDCFVEGGANNLGIKVSSFGHGVCTFEMLDLTSSSTLCTDTSGNSNDIIACPTTTGVHAYTVSVTTASACTAFVSCGTVSFSFPTAYGTSPKCSGTGVQDTTTSTQLWVTGISAISASSITWAYGPLVTTGSAHSLVLTFTCGTS